MRKMNKDIQTLSFDLSADMMNALLRGDKLSIKTPDYYFELIPPNYQKFHLTKLQMEKLKQLSYNDGARSVMSFIEEMEQGYVDMREAKKK